MAQLAPISADVVAVSAALPSLAVCLIVRDERAQLGRCLASVKGLATEVIVLDTGSRDDTVAVATRPWTTVSTVRWNDHFAQARNAALARCSAEWVLSIDADEVVVGDRDTLYGVLANIGEHIDACAVLIANAGGPDVRGLKEHYEFKLFRRVRSRWVGRIHERLQRIDGSDLRTVVISSELLNIRHYGYLDPVIVMAKAVRNARLCELELDVQRKAKADPVELAALTLDLGRSYFGCQRIEESIEAFHEVRKLARSGPNWLWATDFLVHLALERGRAADGLSLIQELADAGVATSYCSWLRANALVLRGDLEHADLMLSSISTLVDVGNNVLDTALVKALRQLIAKQALRSVR